MFKGMMFKSMMFKDTMFKGTTFKDYKHALNAVQYNIQLL